MHPRTLFRNRRAAGGDLAADLGCYRTAHPIVVGATRGGVVVAREVAEALGAQCDVSAGLVDAVPACPQPADLSARLVIIIDDGVATDSVARAAVQAARERGARRVVMATPVGEASVLQGLASVADEVVCGHRIERLHSVDHWYDDFSAVSDEDLLTCFESPCFEREPERPSQPAPAPKLLRVRIPVADSWLEGDLTVPADSRGLVVFAQSARTARHCSGNDYVALELQRSGFSTLLVDLLTSEERAVDARKGHLSSDVALLASRLVLATDWILGRPSAPPLSVAYFASGSGAAAALVAAAERPHRVHAVVCRGGRPDLARASLANVQAPTLFVVGDKDVDLLETTRKALSWMRCKRQIATVAGATHLFEEHGALEEVAELASNWVRKQLQHEIVEATG